MSYIYLRISKIISGAPSGFCSEAHAQGKPASFLFAVEGDNTKFFSCVSSQATQCQSCAASLVFNQVCQACMRFKTGM